MAGSRTLKLSILGDVNNLTKSLQTASTDVDSFGDKIGKVGKVIGAAFVAAAAAAGAYAVKIGIDGVKAALEDEKAQRILALTLENTTGATNAQIAAVEDYITKTALATGVTDDQLRPALSRLVRSTKDTEEAQKLLSLALDISSATGKPLEAIANSLGKAYDGNTNALGKLGLGIDQSILKTKDFNKVYESLRGSFAGFAAQEANTFQGRLDRLNVAFDEAKETIGFALLPVLSNLITFVNDKAVPIITALADSFSLKGEGGLGRTINDVGAAIKSFVLPIFDGMKSTFDKIKATIVENKDEFQAFFDVIKYAAPIIGTVVGKAFNLIGSIASVVLNLISNVLAAIKPLLNTAIDGINLIIKGINAIKPGEDISSISKIGAQSFATSGAPGAIKGGGSTSGTTGGGFTGSGTTSGGTTSGGTTGGGVTAAVASAVAATKAVAGGGFTDSQNAARLIAAGGGGFTDSQNAARLAAQAPQINITVNGAIDREGTARTIVETLNDSYYRGTGGASALQAI
jgi:hypothetical protein